MQILDWYSSELCYVDGICQGKLSKDLLGKKNDFIQEIQNQTIDSVYTDDFTDIPLLKKARQKNIIVYPKTDPKCQSFKNLPQNILELQNNYFSQVKSGKLSESSSKNEKRIYKLSLMF